MSHELRTPLNSVIALSGVLYRRLAGQIPEEEYSYLEVIERNGKHLLSLINDILDISRIEAGCEEVEITKFNANSLVAEIAGMIHQLAAQKKIELLHADHETVFTVTSDADKCRHILQNLIANAVKFTEEGKVELTVRQSGKNIEIKVTDTGIGIDETHLPHIFDEFRQADGSTSRKYGGTGLGLAIAKKYANLLGGAISVKSTLAKGSTFTLILPVLYAAENRVIKAETTADSRQTIKQAPRRHASDSSAKTILLVEDSEPAIIQLTDILEESGYQILAARDGGEALGIIAQTIPDAMVLDLMMPGIDGFEVLKTIREAERTAHIPVLILTAKHITKEELGFLKRNNIHQLIQKGDVHRGELQNAVAEMVFPETDERVSPLRELQIIEGKPLVLIVEDNPDNMITVKALLDGNYTVIEAADGKNGVEMARRHKPNLILMDIALPGMNGIEAFKAIRSDTRLQHIPVIALTASAMVSDRETILAHGFNAYIAKPINERLLFKSINEELYGD
jgi:CheY-like chemotaxis protein